jgi:hypothetical protein
LIRDMSVANPLWGAQRINGELLKLGIDIGQTTSPRTATARAPHYLPASVRVGAARCAPSAHDVRPLASYFSEIETVGQGEAGCSSPQQGEKAVVKTCRSAEAAALLATAALLLALLGERPALAGEQGTEQGRKACMSDVFRLCNAFIPNPEQIVACLQQNVNTLSSACREVMDGAAQP